MNEGGRMTTPDVRKFTAGFVSKGLGGCGCGCPSCGAKPKQQCRCGQNVKEKHWRCENGHDVVECSIHGAALAVPTQGGPHPRCPACFKALPVEKARSLSGMVTYKRHEDDEYWDEIRMVTVPRWKESELSGDEWRFSVKVEFLRKGHVVYTTGFSNLEYAMKALATLPDRMMVGGDGEGLKHLESKLDNSYCFNPGCKNKATVEYRLKKEFCQVAPYDGGHEPYFDTRRRFCDTHKHRGDCALEDADVNYETIPYTPEPE